MCTVVFIPAKNKYYFASLRDEDPHRERAVAPFLVYTDNGKYLAPADPKGGGTWAGVHEYGSVIILLNGGFINHTKKDNYLKSRGAIVQELLADDMPLIAWTMMDLNNIEPFTLIMLTGERLFQLVWDGEKKHRINLPKTQPHLFSSATLYSTGASDIRRDTFNNWLATKPLLNRKSLFNFFKTCTDTQNGFIIDRGQKIKTLSYTFMQVDTATVAKILYYDIASNSHHESVIDMRIREQICISSFNYSNK